MGLFQLRSATMTTRDEFESAYAALATELVDELSSFEMPPHAVRWVDTLLRTAVTGGKMTRGMTVVNSLAAIRGGDLSDDEKRLSTVLGWCIELLQAYFLVADDIMDQSITRRGKPCWYRSSRPIDGADESDEVQLIAINDSFIIFSGLFRLLKKYFRSFPYYVDLLELFNEVTYQTELGQLLDLTSQPSPNRIDLTLFTIENYKLIVKYKTAFYSFYLPVALALLMAGRATKEALDIARPILLAMGEYFQVQDDYLDCYGTPELIGKVGRDIEENKCGWLIVQALARCTPEQRKVFENHYGRDSPDDVAIIKKLYKELDVESIFAAYEEQSYKDIREMIDTVDETHVPKLVFDLLLQKIYKRKL